MPKTAGELLFEEYLASIKINDWAYENSISGTQKRPDYSFSHAGALVLLDVKDFRGEIKDFDPDAGFGPYDPYRPIREKINEGSRKFKDLKSYPCALATYSRDKPLVDLRPMFVYGAMLGNRCRFVQT
jgi:hypothetical protein